MPKNKCAFLVAGENSTNEYERQGHQNKENWMLPVYYKKATLKRTLYCCLRKFVPAYSLPPYALFTTSCAITNGNKAKPITNNIVIMPAIV